MLNLSFVVIIAIYCPQGTLHQQYDRVCQSMPEYARVCQSMPEYARVLPSFVQVIPKLSPGSAQEVPKSSSVMPSQTHKVYM